MNIITAHGSSWQNPAHTAILLTVDFEGLGPIPFSATPDDTEAHGRDLYARALAGEFGPVAECVAPVLPLLTGDQVRSRRNTLLSACDWTQLPDAPEAGRATWATYRQALRDVTAQAGFPGAVEWPEQPA